MLDSFRRVNHRRPCPICKRPNHEHQSTWCIVAKDDGVAICQFVADGSVKFIPRCGGFLHRLRERDPNERPREIQRPRRPEPPSPNWRDLMNTFAMAIDEERLNRLADGLGVTSQSLDLLDIGFIHDTTWSFPMFNAKRNPVGIRTRTEDGQKRAIKGTKMGLFIPSRRRDGLLIFAEGPTDCAAMLDLEFDCIGRPSCYGCEEWCAELSRRRNVAIIADNDDSEVGKLGAERLANAIWKSASCVKIIHAGYAKDARAGKAKHGLSRDSILMMWGAIKTWTGN